ncbi:MAG: amidohydrolase family protein [Candidatus Heimdallarchaeota archaeon]|nr:amidohydrolase family protein [Candidatus Heimdallarchaeota archaeon]MDH5645038.1 amidohydrolase family protein [Candidatus Heimdallarchaeota archaeon]
MRYRIDSDLVIVGDGISFKNGTIIVDNNSIEFVGEQENAPVVENTIQTPVIMPGMWEAHAHFTGLRTVSLETSFFQSSTLLGIRSVWDVNQVLKAGFTSVREVGGFGIHLNKAIKEGLIPGPRIYSAGNVIGATGGHSDIHSLPLDIFQRYIATKESFIGTIADGVDEVYKSVRTQIRNGAEVIKYCASGGVMSEIDHPIHQQFSNEEQKAIVEEADRAQLAVAAHCHGSPGIQAAIKAGVKTIEHGSYLTEELAQQMIEKNIILVPTRYIIDKLHNAALKMGMPEYAVNKMKTIYDRHLESLKIAIKMGVTIALGTDIFFTGPGGPITHGDNAKELEYYVNAGMKPEEAIKTATGNGPLTLGLRAPKSGILKQGYDADMLLLSKNPLEDITILQNRENISKIIKSGIIV